MIRILIIGRLSDAWTERVSDWAPDAIEVDGARLPAGGVRKIEELPPDAVLIVEDADADRASTLVGAIRERPIGKLIPIVVLAPPASEEQGDRVDAWLGPGTDEPQVRAKLESALGESLSGGDGEGEKSSGKSESDADERQSSGDASGPKTRSTSEKSAAPGRNDGEDVVEVDDETEKDSEADSDQAYFIEEIPEDRPRRVDRESLFDGSGESGDLGDVDEETIRRKLEEVRHEDYFSILELRRGCSTQQVREAYHRLRQTFGDGNLDFEIGHRHADDLDEIRDAIEDAWAVLGDPGLRQDYLEATTE